MDLVIINSKKEAVTSHVIIAEGMRVTQDAALKLITKYRSELQEFGKAKVLFNKVLMYSPEDASAQKGLDSIE